MDSIRERRERVGLSLQDVADALGVKKQTVGQWELQGCRPVDGHAEKLEEVLNNPDRYRHCTYTFTSTSEELDKMVAKLPELKNHLRGLKGTIQR